jgi:ribosomal protein S18 acetylase RimI-like enzyme
LVAELDDELVGAAWARLFSEQNKGYGFIDYQTPELNMAVLEGYRNIDIGSKLLTGIFKGLKNKCYRKVSLSVDKSNYALNLYLKFGFEIFTSTETSVTMIKPF